MSNQPDSKKKMYAVQEKQKQKTNRKQIPQDDDSPSRRLSATNKEKKNVRREYYRYVTLRANTCSCANMHRPHARSDPSE